MFITVLTVLLLAKFGVSTPYTNCGSKLGLLKSAKIFDCDDNQEHGCYVKTGTKQNVEISFKLYDPIKELTSVVLGTVYTIADSITAPLPMENNNACKDSGLSCPLDKNKPYTYKTTIEIPRNTYQTLLKLEWKLKDESNTTAICVSLKANLT
ncbi:NPC intracellular cholesterol transporter 2 homolog a-like [Zophobas morio]|uniref:NPC intracellular cholesterol transporter 2 homolog a-like n=1 Tax=Zophobas morio TaxID=2755281 RepID=UPI00308371ED